MLGREFRAELVLRGRRREPADSRTVGGADTNGGGTALLNQQAIKVAASKYAIGRVARRSDGANTSVLIDFRSTVMTGGVEGSSASGV